MYKKSQINTHSDSSPSTSTDQEDSCSKDAKCLDSESIFDNLKYICDSTDLIVQSLQKGLDVVQMKDGDVILTEVKTVNTVYSWDKTKNKLVKISHH